MLVSGGWQAAAAALAMFAALVFLASVIALGVASERPRPAGPAWARQAGRAPGVASGHPAPAPSADGARAEPTPARRRAARLRAAGSTTAAARS